VNRVKVSLVVKQVSLDRDHARLKFRVWVRTDKVSGNVIERVKYVHLNDLSLASQRMQQFKANNKARNGCRLTVLKQKHRPIIHRPALATSAK
jgi:hypothetical protein